MKAAEVLHTERLRIRKLEVGDAENIFSSYASNPRSVRYVSWPVHQSILDTKKYLDYATKSWVSGNDFPYAIEIKASNEFIGSIGFVNEEGRVYIGYILSPDHEGRGYATEAATCLLNYLADIKEIYRIWACCATENVASARVLEKSGMIHEGIVKDWVVFPNLNNESRDCHFYYYPLKRSTATINI